MWENRRDVEIRGAHSLSLAPPVWPSQSCLDPDSASLAPGEWPGSAPLRVGAGRGCWVVRTLQMTTIDTLLHPGDAGQASGNRVTCGVCWNSDVEGPKASAPNT